MSDKNEEELHDYRRRSTFWLTVLGLVVIPPFLINNLFSGRTLMTVESVLILLALALQAWKLHTHQPVQKITSFILTPIVILFLVSSIMNQSVIGAMWCYPSMIAFYFMMPRQHAIIATIVLIIGTVPAAFIVLEPELAYRVAATLLCTGLFSGTFVMLIERQQEQLALKERQRRDAMASASHELRTPLATLMGQVDAMIDGIRPVDQNGLERLSCDVVHISRLVDDLFLLSQSDVQAVAFNLGDVSLAHLFRESETASAMPLSEKQLSVKVDLDSSHIVEADSQRLRQVFDNLLSNCCRYTTTGGEIHVNSRAYGKHIVITFSDTGPGVSDADLPLLFDRFYRVEKSRARVAGGSGLGLSLVKVLVEGQGGTISAHHSREGGLGFEISLPKAR